MARLRLTVPDPRPGFEHVAHVVSRTMKAVGEIEHQHNLDMHAQFTHATGRKAVARAERLRRRTPSVRGGD